MTTITDALIKLILLGVVVGAGILAYHYVQAVKEVAYLTGKIEMLEYNLEMTEQYPYHKRTK